MQSNESKRLIFFKTKTLLTNHKSFLRSANQNLRYSRSRRRQVRCIKIAKYWMRLHQKRHHFIRACLLRIFGEQLSKIASLHIKHAKYKWFSHTYSSQSHMSLVQLCNERVLINFLFAMLLYKFFYRRSATADCSIAKWCKYCSQNIAEGCFEKSVLSFLSTFEISVNLWTALSKISHA